MFCPQCGTHEFKALCTPGNGLRAIVNSISYVFTFMVLLWLGDGGDPPCLALRRRCGNCGFTGRERPDVSAYCPGCGYNISSNPTTACPECGHPPRGRKKPAQVDQTG